MRLPPGVNFGISLIGLNLPRQKCLVHQTSHITHHTSNITYCIWLEVSYGGAPDCLVSALQVKQLKEACFVCGYSSYYWSRENLPKTCGWLSVRQQEFYSTTLLAHKIVSTSLPHSLSTDMVQPHTVRTRAATQGQIRYGTNYRKEYKVTRNSFKYIAQNITQNYLVGFQEEAGAICRKDYSSDKNNNRKNKLLFIYVFIFNKNYHMDNKNAFIYSKHFTLKQDTLLKIYVSLKIMKNTKDFFLLLQKWL